MPRTMRYILQSAIWISLLPAILFAKELASPLRGVELQQGTSIVFLGDSITHQRLYTQYVEDYLYTQFPRLRLHLHNAGVGGARAADALARFDRDVARYKPDYVTVLLGMNDGTYGTFDDETFDIYRLDMLELTRRIRAIGATPILMTPTMFDSRAARALPRRVDVPTLTLYNSVLAYYGGWLREIALENGFGFVDLWSPLNNITLERRKADPTFTLIRDGVHPGPAGQAVMAASMLRALGLPRAGNQIHLTVGPEGRGKADVAGGDISAVTYTDVAVEFQWMSESIPWILPKEAVPGVEHYLRHRDGSNGGGLYREVLQIEGLAPGPYELSIDDQMVGIYDSAHLRSGVNLDSNPKTPQHQQAQEVASLNKQRNQGPVGRLRTEWVVFQRHERLNRSGNRRPGDVEWNERVSDLAEALEDRDDRIAENEAQARELEDRIYRIAQPRKRTYRIHRVSSP